MSKRRCINTDIYENDAFLSLSIEAKIFYTYFQLQTDDRGVVDKINKVYFVSKTNEKALNELIENNFIYEIITSEGNRIYLDKYFLSNNSFTSRKFKIVESRYIDDLIENGFKIDRNKNCYSKTRGEEIVSLDVLKRKIKTNKDIADENGEIKEETININSSDFETEDF